MILVKWGFKSYQRSKFPICLFVASLLIIHGDIETNPGPKSKNSKYVSCCHWNVNSTLAHDKTIFIKRLQLYPTLYKNI